ncbi:hypothetical protein V5O48_004864 [Marasmius crinis-equi]|uniref:F-box domain-containing protein n=1 Tax=Marasmius crinis-equi TaxID=585013 RepID=A0ABR3FNU8_9AGAR
MGKRRKVVSSDPQKEVKNVGHGDGGEKKKGKVARRGGALRYIKEMPLDVLFEIFGYLEPFDLLRLSRTSKDLRRALISRSSKSVWKAARANLGVPDPLPSMSEPKFAHFMFDPHCHFCRTATVHHIAWWAALRCCKACLPEYFSSPEELQDRGILADVPLDFWKILPRYPLVNGPMGQRRWRRVEQVYLVSAAEDLHRHFLDYPSVACMQWLTEKLNAVVDDLQGTYTVAFVQQLILCKRWAESRSTAREQELEDAREARFDAIVQKLHDLGWGQELAFEQGRRELRKHKLVNQPKSLTAKIWKNIETPLSEFMSSVKAARLQREYVAMCGERLRIVSQILEDRKATLPRGLISPPALDVALWEPVRTVIEGLPTEAGASPSSFDEALTGLQDFIVEWNQTRTQHMLSILRQNSPDATEADLHRATTLFRCCGSWICSVKEEIIPYPAILTHTCFDSNLSGFTTELPKWARLSRSRPSSDSAITLDTDAMNNTVAILEACGMPLSTTTFDEMLTKNPLVECKTCSKQEGFRVFWRWTSAV